MVRLHAELGDAFARLSLDRENKVVIFTGTGDLFITEFDDQEVSPETDVSHMNGDYGALFLRHWLPTIAPAA